MTTESSVPQGISAEQWQTVIALWDEREQRIQAVERGYHAEGNAIRLDFEQRLRAALPDKNTREISDIYSTLIRRQAEQGGVS